MLVECPYIVPCEIKTTIWRHLQCSQTNTGNNRNFLNPYDPVYSMQASMKHYIQCAKLAPKVIKVRDIVYWTFDKNGPFEWCKRQCYQRETGSQKNEIGINWQFGQIRVSSQTSS